MSVHGLDTHDFQLPSDAELSKLASELFNQEFGPETTAFDVSRTPGPNVSQTVGVQPMVVQPVTAQQPLTRASLSHPPGDLSPERHFSPQIAPASDASALDRSGAPSPSISIPPGSDWQAPPTPTGYYFIDEVTRHVSPEDAAKLNRPLEFDPIVSADNQQASHGSLDLNVKQIRDDFPILNEQVNGRPLVWLDNAATTQKPKTVIDRMSEYFLHENSNVHRAAHELARRSTDAYEHARSVVAKFLGAQSEQEIVFVRGATEAINLVAQTFGRQHVQQGDDIVISHLEHHANIVPWQILAAERGAKLKVIPVDNSGQVILEEYAKLLSHRTKIVSFSQVSNALGTVTPAAEMIGMAHSHGIPVLLDGAQSVSHMPVNVSALDADFFVFSGHKVFAPTGIGVLYGKKPLLDTLPPWQGGGNMIQDVTFERTIYHNAPARFEAGTGSIADAVGLGAALEYVMRIGMQRIAAHEHQLLEYGTAGLQTIPGLRIIGTAAEKAGVLSFVIDDKPTEAVGKAISDAGIACRAGHHCAQPILRRFGLESTVRASLALYNTPTDLDALVEVLRNLTRGRNQSL